MPGADLTPVETLPPLVAAAQRGDLEAVRRELAGGAAPGDAGPALRHACAAAAPAAARIAIAECLLDAGASPRHTDAAGGTALHAAARHGPVALVELLIRRGALYWQADGAGQTALDHARAGTAPDTHAADRDAIIHLLDRPVIRDPLFRQAVAAIHAGDVAALDALLAAQPGLLHEPAREPDCYPRDYFRDPKLFWFVANNPILVPRLPETIVAVAQAMIARGVARADLDYALELVMTGAAARAQGLQEPLIDALMAAGASPSAGAVLATLAHRETAAVTALLGRGLPLTAPIAAALGRVEALPALLAAAGPAARQEALALAVVNGQVEAARLCLGAGADPNAFMPVHAHSTPLHQAALDDNVAMLGLLLAAGAECGRRDTLWNGTPLGWALHNGKDRAAALLRAQAPA